MTSPYVHGYDPGESIRLQDQAATLAELLHSDTVFPAGSRVLEAGCGVGAQKVDHIIGSAQQIVACAVQGVCLRVIAFQIVQIALDAP